MALRPVQWAIGNGAENSVELARASLYVGSNGATGIVGINDFKVSALPTPGAAVRVAKGTGVIASNYPGTFGQSYAVQEQSFTDVPVAATGSSGAAVKYVYVLIEDTQYSGQTPPSVEDGPYNSYQVTTTLPTAQPYLLLARINQPASTATIQNTHITDLREVANPRKQPELRTYALLAGDTTVLTNTNAYPGGATWPVAVEEAWGEIPIPSWATRAKVIMMWTGVRTFDGNVYGGVWVQIGQTNNPSNKKTQKVAYNSANPSDVVRDTLIAADNVYIPAALRGTSQKFYPRGCRESSGSGRLSLDGGSSMILQVEFMEQPD